MNIRLSILFLIQVLLIPSAFSSNIVVDQLGNGDFDNITEAVASISGDQGSSTFDTILVRPGYYVEDLNLDNFQINIAIIGSSRDDVILYVSSSALNVNNYNYSSGLKLSVANISFMSSNAGRTIAYIQNSGEGNFLNFYNCKFYGKVYLYNNRSDINFYNCIFTANQIGLHNYFGYGTLSVANSIFYDSENGINVENSSGSTNVYNSIFWQNTWAMYGGLMLSLHNLFYENSYNDNQSGNLLGPNDLINEDPFFIDSENFLLESNSPCFDNGIPVPAYNDLDGSRNDIGLHGGPYAPFGMGPVITNISATPNPVSIGQTITIEATGTSE